MSTESGIELIAAERQRQIEAEGWTPEHDARHRNFELARAAAVYALDAWPGCGWSTGQFWPSGWQFKGGGGRDPVRTLTKAGALIAAEIDRLRTAPMSDATPSPGDPWPMPDNITVLVEIPGWMVERLNVLIDDAAGLPDLAAVIDKLLDHVQQAVCRPGSWERGWCEQVFGGGWQDGLEPDTDRTAGDGRVIFQRPIRPCPNDPPCRHPESAHDPGAGYPGEAPWCLDCDCGDDSADGALAGGVSGG